MHKYSFVSVNYKEGGSDFESNRAVEANSALEARRKLFEQDRSLGRWIRSYTLKAVNGVPVPYDQ
jgi:hypothetical protein